ncbi:histidine kinase [Photobacterium sp. MCCC 1A19761]|uniref:sensor histidine kinase n=1 Tax=Photobacterium sp. MCCC 1A19761 TaxID=3115000 RepID=UPI00307CE055
MQSKERYRFTSWDMAISLVLCVGIACITYILKGGDFNYHLIIALGYGTVCNLISFFVRTYFPMWRTLTHSVVVISVTIVLGTLHALLWLVWLQRQGEVAEVLFLVSFALFFSSCIYYFFYCREKALLYKHQLRQVQLVQAEHEKALVVSQLKVLQSQIEPHFLFNTLANLQVLIDADPKKAQSLLLRLTELLRISLKKSRRDQIKLEDEIELLEAYLEIQSIRLGERLRYRFVVAPDVDPCWHIPPHLLQPLVENAVCHGIEPCPAGGEVVVSLSGVQGRLQICVEDDGAGLGGKSLHKGNGLSLDNIRQRLKALYGSQASLSIASSERGGVISKIELIPGDGL